MIVLKRAFSQRLLQQTRGQTYINNCVLSRRQHSDPFTSWLVLIMSALFNFQSLLTVILLLICTCTYVRSMFPSLLDRHKTGVMGTFWKCARIGERKSPYVGFACLAMAFSVLFW